MILQFSDIIICITLIINGMALYSGKSTNNNREWDNHRDDREEAASLLQDDDEPNNRNHSTRNHHRDGIIKRCFSFLFNGILSFIEIDHNSPIIIQMKSLYRRNNLINLSISYK